MKKKVILLTLAMLLPVGYLGMSHFSGGAYPTMGLPIGGERGKLRDKTMSFIEDIKFKDFAKAASYHDPKIQEQIDIPYLLERMFMLKPEALDIMEYDVVFAELDSSSLRGRVKVRIKFKDLVKGQIHEKEVIYFYHRASEKEPWFMVLESSLRQIKGDDNKTF
jgi:hypothetical protein